MEQIEETTITANTNNKNLNVNDFNKICLICLSKKELKSFFKLSFGDLLLPDVFREVTSLQIKVEDKMPKQICFDCIERLICSFTFICKCRETSNILEGILTSAEVATDNANNELLIEEEANVDNCDQSVCSNVEVEVNYEKRDKPSIKTNEHSNLNDEESVHENKNTQLHLSNKCVSASFSCVMCKEHFNSSLGLRTHLRNNPKCKRPKICKICNKQFQSIRSLTIHELIHTGKKPYKCDLCSMSFNALYNLKRHTKTHSGNKEYFCEICGQGFTRLETKNGHIKKFHNNKFKCKHCTKTFKHENVLISHEEKHSDQSDSLPKKSLDRQLCNICGKTFSSNMSLKKHSVVHTGIKDHFCSICGKSFSYKSGLNSHILRHKGFSCFLCNKYFTQRSHLKSHYRIHTGEKPHVCNLCGKAFALHRNLVVHRRTHIGETPYCCTYCSIGFYDSTSLKNHMNIHES